MYKIDGLSKEQVILLNAMWKLDTLEELEEWKNTLTPRKQKLVEVLREMIVAAALDFAVNENSTKEEMKDSELIIYKVKRI